MYVCRVCLEYSDELISLKSDKIETLLILHMLKEFTINAIHNTEYQLPDYICHTCATNLEIAFKFKRQFEDSIIKFIGGVESSEGNTNDNQIHSTAEDVPIQSNAPDENTEQSEWENELTEETKENLPLMTLTQSQKPLEIKISAVYQLCTTESSNEQRGDSPVIIESSNDNSDVNLEDTAINDISNQSIPHENEELSKAPHENKLQINLTIRPQIQMGDQREDLNKITPMECVPDVSHTADDVESLFAKNNQSSAIATEEKQLTLTENFSKPTNRNQRKAKRSGNRNILTTRSNRNRNHSSGRPNISSEYKSPVNLLVNRSNDRTVNLLNYSNRKNLTSTSEGLRAIKKKFRSVIISSIKDTRNFDSALTKKIIGQIYTDHCRKTKPFQCDVCERWFKTKGHVKTHRMLHISAEYELQCGQCPLRFLTKSHFKVHKCKD